MSAAQPAPDALPSLESIDAARADRGIAEQHFAQAVGFDRHGSWRNAVTQDTIATEKHRRALAVIQYVDDHGYLPEPGEVTADDCPADPEEVAD